ncbi:S8 family serine peptidase [Actinoplanes sp. CA-030573]|uniref:S8 family serine peptidase n=1 Tax=Actinoplanes sp. CA-030573 TaxID=3239898 RepID=UPI003D8E286D
MAAAEVIALAVVVTLPSSPAVADSFRDDQWYLKSLSISRAHAISRGAGVVVGLVDTGAYPHPDITRNLLPGTTLIPGENGDGRSDKGGHGTNMAALIAAHGRGPNDGILGIAPAAKVLPIKISNDEKSIPSAKVIGDGIDWAVANKASVINVSAVAGPAFEIEDAVAAAIKANIVVVAGVGNASSSALVGYPAAIDGVLAVGATGRDGKHASLSVKGAKVQICAPGVDITTAEPERRYVDVDGTSASTAIVSGAAALVRAKFPHLSAPEVINRLTATADDIGPPGRDDECGYGRLNIVRALTADVPPLGKANPPTSATPSAAASGGAPPGYIDPGATTAAQEPRAEESSSSSGALPLVLGVVAGLLAAGGLVAFLVVRRRRGF